VMRGRPSHNHKMKNLPIVRKRDGYVCLYCSESFTDTNPSEIDHLNDDYRDNRPENWVECHRACNVKKKDSPEFQLIAREKLEQNERGLSVRERANAQRMIENTGNTEGLTSSQAISKANMPIAKEWLHLNINLAGTIQLQRAVPSMTAYCRKRTGWGSQQAMRRYIEEWCTLESGEFVLFKEDGVLMIRLRDEKQTIDNKICNKTVKN